MELPPGDVQNINDTTCNFDFVFVMSDKPKRKALKSRTTGYRVVCAVPN